MLRNLFSRLGFVVVVMGTIFLNFSKPPLQIVGLIIFVLMLLYPVASIVCGTAKTGD